MVGGLPRAVTFAPTPVRLWGDRDARHRLEPDSTTRWLEASMCAPRSQRSCLATPNVRCNGIARSAPGRRLAARTRASHEADRIARCVPFPRLPLIPARPAAIQGLTRRSLAQGPLVLSPRHRVIHTVTNRRRRSIHSPAGSLLFQEDTRAGSARRSHRGARAVAVLTRGYNGLHCSIAMAHQHGRTRRTRRPHRSRDCSPALSCSGSPKQGLATPWSSPLLRAPWLRARPPGKHARPSNAFSAEAA